MNRRAQYEDALERDVEGMKPFGNRGQQQALITPQGARTRAYGNAIDSITELALQRIEPDCSWLKVQIRYTEDFSVDSLQQLRKLICSHAIPFVGGEEVLYRLRCHCTR